MQNPRQKNLQTQLRQMSNGFVASCEKQQDKAKYDYIITFSSGLSLGFSDEEVFEHFLYDQDRRIDDIESMCTDVLSARIRRVMLGYIATKVHSVAQTRKYAQEKLAGQDKDGWQQFFTDAFEKALIHLQKLGYLDDYEYCRKYINTTMKLKPASLVMMRHELENVRGVPAQIVESVFGQYEIDDCDAAYRLVVKKAAQTDDKNKIFAYLMRKGFGYETVIKAYRKYIEDLSETEQE